MATKVIVIGGGVAGMTVAHELAQRDGFEVVVYEQRAVPGGKARSIDAVGHETGVRGLPGEHGFRFFPGFYRHVTDTMSQIPFGPGGTVFDNLTQSTRVEIAQRGKRRAGRNPAQFPGSIEGSCCSALQTGWDYATQLGTPARAISSTSTTCSGSSFAPAKPAASTSSRTKAGGSSPVPQQRSPGYRRYLADGLTRTLVAARATRDERRARAATSCCSCSRT